MSSPYVGEIRMFGGNFAPVGWAFCDGSLQSIAQNDVLFNLIGTTYGGDGQTTFGLPDLRGRVPIHAGTGPGLSTRNLAETSGTESVTLTPTQMPLHAHLPIAGPAEGTATSPGGQSWAASTATLPYTASAANTTMNAGALAPTGGNQPHENMTPFLTVTFIIALFGIFPSQT